MLRACCVFCARRQWGSRASEASTMARMKKSLLLEQRTGGEEEQERRNSIPPQVRQNWSDSVKYVEELGSTVSEQRHMPVAAAGGGGHLPTIWSERTPSNARREAASHIASFSQFLTECGRLYRSVGQSSGEKERNEARNTLRKFWEANAEAAAACCVLESRDFGFLAGQGLVDNHLTLPLPSLLIGLDALRTCKETTSSKDMMISLHFLARELSRLEANQQHGKQRENEDTTNTPSTGPTTAPKALGAYREELATFGFERIFHVFFSSSRNEQVGSAGDAIHALEFLTILKADAANRDVLEALCTSSESVLPLIRLKREIFDAFINVSTNYAVNPSWKKRQLDTSQQHQHPHRERDDAIDRVRKSGRCAEDVQCAVVMQLFWFVAQRAVTALKLTDTVHIFALLRVFTPLLTRRLVWMRVVSEELNRLFPIVPRHAMNPTTQSNERSGENATTTSSEENEKDDAESSPSSSEHETGSQRGEPPEPLAFNNNAREGALSESAHTAASTAGRRHEVSYVKKNTPRSVRSALRRAELHQRDALDGVAWGLCVALEMKDSRLVNPYHFLKIMATISRLPRYTLIRKPYYSLSWMQSSRESDARDEDARGGGEHNSSPPGSIASHWLSASSAARRKPAIAQPTAESMWEYLVSKACIFVHALSPSHRRILGESFETALVSLRRDAFVSQISALEIISPLEEEMKQYPAQYEACFVTSRQARVLRDRQQKSSSFSSPPHPRKNKGRGKERKN